jgi:hypothetical protein
MKLKKKPKNNKLLKNYKKYNHINHKINKPQIRFKF